MTTIDSHQHFWTRSRGDYIWLTSDLTPIYRDFAPHDLQPLINAACIDKTIIVQAAATVEETWFMLEIADKTDFVAGVVGWVDFESPDAPDQIANLAQHPKLKGFRPMIQDITDDDWMLRTNLHPAYQAIIDDNLTFDALVFPRHLQNLLVLLGRFPDLKTVIDHGAKPQFGPGDFEPWAQGMTELANSTLACCKISGIITEKGPDWTEDSIRPYIDHLLSAFGPERLIWGSDWPVVNLAGDYTSWHKTSRNLLSHLSDRDIDAVFGVNAVKFYDLDV